MGIYIQYIYIYIVTIKYINADIEPTILYDTEDSTGQTWRVQGMVQYLWFVRLG